MTLAWTLRMNTNIRTQGNVVTRQGGEGDGSYLPPGANLKGSFIVMDDVIYVTSPDHAWALDARDGTELWHYFWHSRGGIHIGNRGPAIWHDSLFFETPDNYSYRRRKLARGNSATGAAVFFHHGADRGG